MEILIVVLLAALAIFILVRSFKKKASGGCDCGSCSSHCAMYRNNEEDKKDN